MYSKKFRLPIAKTKFAWQKTFSSPYFLIKTKENHKEHNRLAIIIANRAIKKSTRRHFWKRAIADELQAWPNLQKDILIIVSPKIEATSKKVMKEEFDKLLKQLTSLRA